MKTKNNTDKPIYPMHFSNRNKLSSGGIPSIPIPHSINTIDYLKIPINIS